MSVKRRLLNLIADGKLKEALGIMRQIEQTQNNYFNDALISLAARNSRNERDKSSGIISTDEYRIERNRIEAAVRNILDSEFDESKIPQNLQLQIVEPPRSQPIPTPAPTPPIGEGQALKILMLTAMPAKTNNLDVHKEFSEVYRRLQAHRNDFHPVIEHNVSVDDFREKTDTFKPHILHFSGHGIDREDIVGLVLQNEYHNGYELLIPEQLEILFGYFSSQFKIEVVILNACLSNKQAEAIAKYVPYVVGTQVSIEDTQSIAFSAGFYFKFVESNQDYRASFLSGRTAARMKNAQASDFVFYKNGKLWHIDDSQ